MRKKGSVYVFTGEGKGKTSAALGVMVRSSLRKKKVVWISWYKDRELDFVEKKLPSRLEKLEMFFVGRGFYIKGEDRQELENGVGVVKVGDGKTRVVDKVSEEEHVKAAEKGLQLMKEKLSEEGVFLVVLDEVLNALSDGLVEEEEFLEILREKGEINVVLTGRGASERLIKEADLVTECRKIKHPYDRGKLAVEGLDY